MPQSHIDYHTLFLASGITAAASMVLLAFQTRKAYPGFHRILLGIAFITAAIAIAYLRGFVPDSIWSIQVACLLAFALIDSGIRLFSDSPRRGNWPYLYVATAILVLTYLYLTQPVYLRIIINSLLLIPIFVDASAPLLRTSPERHRFGYRLTATVLMAAPLLACVRIVAVYSSRGHPDLYFSANLLNTVFFFLVLGLLLALAFGFISLTHERVLAELESVHGRFRLLFENAPLGIVLVDEKGSITSANHKFAEMSGYSTEESVGFTAADISPAEDRAVVKELDEALLCGRLQATDRERLLLQKNGSTIWASVTTRLMRDELGSPRWGIEVFQDISERRRAEGALRQSEEKFRAVFENAPLGIAECTLDGRFSDVNSKLVEILGYTKDEITHLTITDLTHPADLERSLAHFQRLIAGEITSETLEKRYIRKDRSFVWVNTTISLTSIHGKPKYMIMAVEDITARKKAEDDLKRAIEASYHDAKHDMLTGLANRASFKDRLMEAVAYAKRDGHFIAVHFLDLDRFKSINDTLGHEIGDMLLKNVAARIQSHIRETDLAARLGGDEFVILQTHLTEAAAAGVLAGKLAEDLRRNYIVKDHELECGASIGVAMYPSDAEDPEALMNRADLALYDAKLRGRGNCQFYRKELGEAYRETQHREQELVRALKENEFFLHYQPEFDLKSGRITGIEALLRWCHPERGQLEAAEFIWDAEHNRLMLPIGEWVLQTACRQYKEWLSSSFNVPLTLNLSSMQLQDPRLLGTLERILQETGMPAAMLRLEMRESVLWEPKFSRNLPNQMKASGLQLTLDDFGSEMTALATLDRFPLDVVKVDRGLVRALPSRKREAAIVAAIVRVAHDLKIAVCADGVETASQLAAVKEQGCDSVQGYFLSSPLNRDAMKRRIDLDLVH